MALREPVLTDEQWETIKPLLPELPKNPKGGRPWADMRKTLEGIVWILRSGARWKDLPREFPSPSTCWRRLKRFQDEGVWLEIWRVLLQKVRKKRRRKKRKTKRVAFGDGTFKAAKKGGTHIGKTKRGKGSKLMMAVDSKGVPMALLLSPANPGEVKLIENTLENAPNGLEDFDILVYDKAADSDPLRERLQANEIELVCPHRSNRKKEPTQDRRKLRRYRHRWIVERTFAWLENYRRLVARYEWYGEIYLAFVYLACAFITLKRL